MSTTLSASTLLAVPLAPLAGALIAGILGTTFGGNVIGRRASHTATILGVLVAFVLSVSVLMDVIDETALPVSSRAADPDGPDGPDGPDDPDDPGAPLPLASGWDLQGPGWSHDRQEPATPPARKLGPRPRLLKMMERGLFQNGPDG